MKPGHIAPINAKSHLVSSVTSNPISLTLMSKVYQILTRTLKRNSKTEECGVRTIRRSSMTEDESTRPSFCSHISAFCAISSFSAANNSRCSRNTCLAFRSTISNPSRPLAAFCPNRSTVKSSIRLLMPCQPPHKAVISARWLKSVLFKGELGWGWYCTVSRTLRRCEKVMLMEHIVKVFVVGST